MRAMAVLVLAMGPVAGGCAVSSLGRGPADLELQNDGSDEAQAALVRQYEVVYDRGIIRRPGADPAAVAADIHLPRVDDVSSPAWSDDAYNYLSTSDDAAVVLEHPAVGFDQFAHSGTGEVVILGSGMGIGMVAGALSWFVPTTVADGIDEREQNELYLAVSGGFFAGITLGVIVSAAWTYIVPAISQPFATPMYRKATRAFNDELEERVVEQSPHGDAPPEHDEHDGLEGHGHGEGGHDDDAAAAPEAATPPFEGAPRPVETP